MLVSAQCNTVSYGPCLFQQWGWEHSLFKVARLQCKTAGHRPCLFHMGGGVGYNVKLLAMVLIYFSRGGEHSLVKVAKLHCKIAGYGPCLFQQGWGGVGKHSPFRSKTVFSAQTTFTTLIPGPLSYRTGN